MGIQILPPGMVHGTKRDESAEAKPLDYVEPKLPVTNGFGVPIVPPSFVGIEPCLAMPRYFGSDLAREANIKRQMDARDHDKRMEKIRRASDAHNGYFYPTSLSSFVQDHRIMRKGPWK